MDTTTKTGTADVVLRVLRSHEAELRAAGLRHGYGRLDLRVIWAAASERVPSLATSARNVLAKLDEDAGGNRTG